MAAPPDINDIFDLDGFWWIPDNPDLRVAGVLSFSQKDGPVLTLTGTFEPTKRAFGSEMMDRPVIHGLTKDSKAVSLFDALHTGRKGGLGEQAVHEVYKGHILAVGWHFDSDEEQMFTNSYVSFEDIEEWLDHRFFSFDRGDDNLNWALALNRPATRPLAEFDGISLSVGSGFYTDGSSTSFTVTAGCHVKIAASEKRNIRWHLAAASKVQGLASLCTGRHLPLRMIFLDGPEVRYSTDFSRPSEVRLYYSLVHQSSQKVRQHDIPMLRVSDFPEPADEVYRKWFDCYEGLSSGIYLFLTALADRAMFINVRFSLAIQALEVFHRRSYSGTVMAEAEHAALQKVLIAAIPDGTPAAMRDKLSGLLSFSNEPSLGQRLRAMLKDLRAQLEEEPAGYDKVFVRRLVDTRNYYTHYSPDLVGKTLEGADMHYAIRRIVLLLIVLLLLRIGLPRESVRAAIDKHREFKQLWETAGNPS